MYADDAALFVAPSQEEVRTLASILSSFGEVTGLKTNFKKSTIIPIQCQGIDLSSVLNGLTVKRASFPIRYLGLPLSTTRLKNVDFQPVVDKMTGKLNAWNGRNVTMARRLTLVKSVLTSQVIHLLSALRVPKEILQLIDSKRKQFLWAGNEVLTGGKCKVNWIRAARSKKGGGLGILHLGKFSRALRLRWLWKLCKKENGQWLDSETPCTNKDKQFFAAATTITVGNGDSIPFGIVHGFRAVDRGTLHQQYITSQEERIEVYELHF